MKKVVGKFSVEYKQVLDESGGIDERLMPKVSIGVIKKMYELMVLTRAFDFKARKMQRAGRLGTYASVLGQEACQIGSAILVDEGDLIVPAFREHGVFLTRGVFPESMFQYWGGDERGSAIKENILPVSIPVGSHLLHGVGAGMAYKYLGKKNVAITYFGDGATSAGDFHEAMNFAGVFKAPVVFICQNNQYAISVPVSEQTGSETLAQKAIAYGFEGVRVDGNDVFAVYSAMFSALKKARDGKGPTFIECLTYRMGDHTTADDAKKYRDESEIKEWEKKDPILRLKKYLLKKGIVSEKYFSGVEASAVKVISEAVEKFEGIGKASPGEIFDYIFEEKTKDLVDERAGFLSGMKKEVK